MTTPVTAGIIVDSGLEGEIPVDGPGFTAPAIGSFVVIEGVQRQALTTEESIAGIREWATIQPIGWGTQDSAGVAQFDESVSRVANLCRLGVEAQAALRQGKIDLLDRIHAENPLPAGLYASLRRDLIRGAE